MKKVPNQPQIKTERPLPAPATSTKDLRKIAAFVTLAAEQKNEPAAEDARQWVEYDEL